MKAKVESELERKRSNFLKEDPMSRGARQYKERVQSSIWPTLKAKHFREISRVLWTPRRRCFFVSQESKPNPLWLFPIVFLTSISSERSMFSTMDSFDTKSQLLSIQLLMESLQDTSAELKWAQILQKKVLGVWSKLSLRINVFVVVFPYKWKTNDKPSLVPHTTKMKFFSKDQDNNLR